MVRCAGRMRVRARVFSVSYGRDDFLRDAALAFAVIAPCLFFWWLMLFIWGLI